MNVLRAICSNICPLRPKDRKFIPNSLRISFQSVQNPSFFRHFHSTSSHLRSEQSGLGIIDEPKARNDSSTSGKKTRVWSFYDPVSDRTVTQRVSDNGDGQKLEGEETNMGLSSFGDGVEDLAEERTKKTKLGSGPLSFKGIVGNRKKGKHKVSWVCSGCGFVSGQWWGTCRSCHAVGTMKQFTEVNSGERNKITGFEVSEEAVRSWLPRYNEDLPMRLTDVNRDKNQMDWRIALSGPFGDEVSTVLGGGLVPGSLVLVGGDPGVGKSTLLLQVIAGKIAERHEPGKAASVLYVSGEESLEQIGNRADRLRIATKDLFLYSSTDIEDILDTVERYSPQALIIDSIQTVYLKGVTGSAGGLSQVKECTSALLRVAKKTNIPVFLVGHVTKSGDLAGPRVLEHIVDVVLYMEGEKYSSHRLLRSVKNRFGSTDELGVFEMSESGLQAVSNPSELFLSEQYLDSEVLAGLAVAVIMDGSRTFLIEIQALCASISRVQRQVNGIPASRADMIIAVLIKQAGLKLQENAIFLNVISGLTLEETAGDLAIAVAICSRHFPIPNNIAFIGEIGLGGELRMVPRMDKRIHAVAKLGYKKCIVPKAAEKFQAIPGSDSMKVIGCSNLKEVINIIFASR
ncbi:hypothetical protein FEM48_Zijuj01G0284800 [Ziziphus jujuba var. spinosa]|uniref:RecA family profile 1 domain-containing protein n=1 Tax=Ziziphus jujuba var. spinosa TaxID=714518 RepID=A0A978W5H1_ZIZJJ|nr:hypothetical protein FEM48_Zijuj01G0284800 [Ziziphus jujuba var. spinosa]